MIEINKYVFKSLLNEKKLLHFCFVSYNVATGKYMFIYTGCKVSTVSDIKTNVNCLAHTAAPSASLRLRVGPRPRPFHDEDLGLVINLVHDSLLPD